MSDLSVFATPEPATPGPRRQSAAPDSELENLLAEWAQQRDVTPAAFPAAASTDGEPFQAPPVSAFDAANLGVTPSGFTMPEPASIVPGPALVPFDELLLGDGAPFNSPVLAAAAESFPDPATFFASPVATPAHVVETQGGSTEWPEPLVLNPTVPEPTTFREPRVEEPVFEDMPFTPATPVFDELMFEAPRNEQPDVYPIPPREPAAPDVTAFEMPAWNGPVPVAAPGQTVFDMPAGDSPWKSYEDVERHEPLPEVARSLSFPSAPEAVTYEPFQVAPSAAMPTFAQQVPTQASPFDMPQSAPQELAMTTSIAAPSDGSMPAAIPAPILPGQRQFLEPQPGLGWTPEPRPAPEPVAAFEWFPEPVRPETIEPHISAQQPDYAAAPAAPFGQPASAMPSIQPNAQFAAPPVFQQVTPPALYRAEGALPAAPTLAEQGLPSGFFDDDVSEPAVVPIQMPDEAPYLHEAVLPVAVDVEPAPVHSAPELPAQPAPALELPAAPAVEAPPRVSLITPEPIAAAAQVPAPSPVAVPLDDVLPRVTPALAPAPEPTPEPSRPSVPKVIPAETSEEPTNRLVAEVAPLAERMPLTIVAANLPVNEQWLDAALHQLVALGVSDVHILKSGARDEMVIQGRRDGVLEPVRVLRGREANTVLNLVKSRSRISTGSNRVPADGRYELEIDNYPYNLRAVATPLFDGGEKVVLRLPQTGALKELEELGFTEKNLAAVIELLGSPGGVTIIAGPMGEGKTTTAHAALSRIGGAGTALMSVEDPVERVLSHVAQIEVNEDLEGAGFGTIMRYLVRADFDTLFLGEIRDETTAASAVRMAQAGRRVISTIHATDNVTALRRLIEMSSDTPLSVLDSVRGIISQRLVRRVGDGPDGYLGRHPIHEVLSMNDSLIEALVRNQSIADIRAAADTTSTTFAENARQLVESGVTDMKEIRRVLGHDFV